MTFFRDVSFCTFSFVVHVLFSESSKVDEFGFREFILASHCKSVEFLANVCHFEFSLLSRKLFIDCSVAKVFFDCSFNIFVSFHDDWAEVFIAWCYNEIVVFMEFFQSSKL